MKLKTLRILFIFILLVPLFYVLDLTAAAEKIPLPLEVSVFALTGATLIFWPAAKQSFIFASNALFLIMAVFFMLDLPDTANIFGSLGFGILVITAIFYLPSLFKQGHL